MPRKRDRFAALHRESRKERDERDALAWAENNTREWNLTLPIRDKKSPAGQLPSDQYRAALRWEAAREWRCPAELGSHWAEAIDAFGDSSTFSVGDLVNLPSLAAKLKYQKRTFDAWLAAQLSSDTQAALESDQRSGSDPAPLQQVLLQKLNKLVLGASIYQEQRFDGIELRPETKTLMSQNPEGEHLQRLNRLLIEDAYPQEVSRKPLWSNAEKSPEKSKAEECRGPAGSGWSWVKLIEAACANAEKSPRNPTDAVFRVAAICWPSEGKAVAEFDQAVLDYEAAKRGLSADAPDLEEQYFETRQAVRKAEIALEKQKALTGPRDWRLWNLHLHLLKARRFKVDWRVPWRSLPPDVRREWVKAARGPVQVRLLGPTESATAEVDRHSLSIHLPMSASSKQAVDALKAAMKKHKLGRPRPESACANALQRLSILRLSDHGVTWAMVRDLREQSEHPIAKATWHRELKRAKAEFHSGHWLR